MPTPTKAKRTRKNGVEYLAKHPGWKTQAKNSPTFKIFEVKVIREIDTDADTSYYGEYAERATSPYSIDRLHTPECASLEVNHRAIVDKLERIRGYAFAWYVPMGSPFICDEGDIDEPDVFRNYIDQAEEEAQECDCGESGDMHPHEYRYFNPSDNYEGESPEDIRKYVAQDYKRMQDYNENGWCYLGIRAEARIGISTDGGTVYTMQTVRSQGLWGIESDSEDGYFAEVGKDELYELKQQLLALGFSKRAVATAFKTVKEVDA